MGIDISVKEFKKILQEEVQELARLHGWKYDTNVGRGYAFQLWVANTFSSEDRGFDTEPEESLLYENDLKADFVLEDTSRQHMLIAQCKYQSVSDNPPIDESQVNDFFNRHEHLLDSAWVREHGSSEAIDFLGDYAAKIEGGYTVEYIFVSTGTASERTRGLARRCSDVHKEKGLRVTCQLLDFSDVKALYTRTRSLEENIPSEVRIQLPEDRWIEKEEPYPTVIAVIKGNALKDLYKQHKEALFAWNIRGYLGGRGINAKIIETATKRGQEFFYFNNGVSAICTDYRIRDNTLNATNCQIINGAQTVGALAKAPSNPGVEVLFRLTKTASVKTEKGMNIDIIRYNNSQNIIKTSDFHSNDPIQLWLEKQFQSSTPEGPVPKISYQRRRGPKKRGQGQALPLEELAKIRYAFLQEPTLCHSSPKDLWTPLADKGAYEKAFGVDGQLEEMWSKEEFRRCLLATALYLRIEERIDEEGKADPNLKRLKRFRFHALSLAGLCTGRGGDHRKVDELLSDVATFDKWFKEFWSEARRTIIDALFTMDEQKASLHSYVRSADRWESMTRRYSMFVKIP